MRNFVLVLQGNQPSTAAPVLAISDPRVVAAMLATLGGLSGIIQTDERPISPPLVQEVATEEDDADDAPQLTNG